MHLHNEHSTVWAATDDGRGSREARTTRGAILHGSSDQKDGKPAAGSRSIFCTLTVSFIPRGHTEMERLTLTTKAFPGTHTASDVDPWIREVTTEFFAPIVGDANAEPAKIYVAATVD
ncbi:unnamed protein product, partial [Pylaiella littoralis]